MKLLLNGNQELAAIDLAIDASTGMCNPIIEGLGYRIEGRPRERRGDRWIAAEA